MISRLFSRTLALRSSQCVLFSAVRLECARIALTQRRGKIDTNDLVKCCGACAGPVAVIGDRWRYAEETRVPGVERKNDYRSHIGRWLRIECRACAEPNIP